MRSARGTLKKMGRPWYRISLFLVVATVSWMVAGALDLKTKVEITAWNGRIDLTVGDTTISTRANVAEVDSITITAQAGVHPTGGAILEAGTPEGMTRRWQMPGRFSFPHRQTQPVGDWWVDETADVATVFSASIPLGSEFTVRGIFTGRHHQHLTMTLGGAPGISCAFRRGLLNNDLLIFDDQGEALTWGAVDPQPLDRLGATTSTVLRAIAGGALLLALWSGIPGLERRKNPIAPPLATPVFISVLTLFALGGAGLAVWTAVDIFGNLPHLPDEIVYQLQGRWLMSGHLTGMEPPCSENFAVPLTYMRGGRWVGHYPPAWPLFLVPGIAIGAPWLVPALLRVLHILVIASLALRLGGRWTALAAAAAALTSPLALLLFGSRMPHAGSATLLLVALLLCLPKPRRTSAGRWFLAGIAFGLAFGMRPLTAVAVALPVGVFLTAETLSERRRWRDGLWLICGGLTATLPTFLANAAITGSPWAFPYSLAEGSMYSIRHAAFGIRNLDTLLASLGPLVHGWGWPWLSGPASLALPFAFVAVLFLSRSSTREDRLLAVVAITVVLAHLGARATGLHGFGPRYFFVPCCIAWVLTARGAAALASREKHAWPAAALVLGLLTLSAAAVIPERLSLYRGYNDVTTTMRQAASALPDCSLVLFSEDNWRGWAEASPWLGRDPNDDHTVPLFAADLGETLGLEWCFPDRRIFRWTDGHMVPTVDETD